MASLSSLFSLSMNKRKITCPVCSPDNIAEDAMGSIVSIIIIIIIKLTKNGHYAADLVFCKGLCQAWRCGKSPAVKFQYAMYTTCACTACTTALTLYVILIL